jgi:branched-chain amino acid transport system ATP-binding protein
MLKLTAVRTFYGPIEALKGIDIEVKQGEIVCLIGNNGAGKSTILMTISGILKPRSGNITFENGSIAGSPPHMIVRKGISQAPEGRRIFPKLTVRENLEMGAYPIAGGGVPFFRKQKTINRKQTAHMERVFGLFPVLKERHGQMGGTLSGGEQQMLAIGRALMSAPKLLLLDEPSLGLAPIIASRIFKIVKEINEEGVTIVLVEQNARAALKLSHRGYVLENGSIILQGQGRELLGNEQVRKAYLGEQ